MAHCYSWTNMVDNLWVQNFKQSNDNFKYFLYHNKFMDFNIDISI